LKAVYACVLIIIGTLLITGFLGYEHGAESNIVQITSAQGISGEIFSSIPSISDFNSTSSPQIVNSQDRPQNITLIPEKSNSQASALVETNNSAEHIDIGVNYLSAYHLYSPKYTTDAILNFNTME
jgi:hypothetical protein